MFSIQFYIDLYIKITLREFYTRYVADRLALGKCQEHYMLVIGLGLQYPHIKLCGDIPTPYGLIVLTHIAHVNSVHLRDPTYILCLLTYEGLIRKDLNTMISSYKVEATPKPIDFVNNPTLPAAQVAGREHLAFPTIFTYELNGIFGHSTMLYMECAHCCDKFFSFLSINEVNMKQPEKMMLCDLSNGTDYLIGDDGYTWQLTHKSSISYMVNSQSKSVVHFKVWTEPLASKMYNLSKEMPSLLFNINTNITEEDVFYRKYTIQSDSFIKIRFRKINVFSGYTHECNYGGIAILPGVGDWNSMAGIYCTEEDIYPLLGTIKEFYSQKHEISLVIFSYVGYFHIDIMVEVTQTQCEGWA